MKVSASPLRDPRGKYRGRGPNADEARREARAEEALAEGSATEAP